MACGCSQNKNIEYEVKFKDGTTRRVSTATEALNAIRGNGGTYKAVPK